MTEIGSRVLPISASIPENNFGEAGGAHADRSDMSRTFFGEAGGPTRTAAICRESGQKVGQAFWDILVINSDNTGGQNRVFFHYRGGYRENFGWFRCYQN